VSSPEANTLGIGGVAGLDDDIEDQAAWPVTTAEPYRR
jgi:hypothetical protein